MPCCADGTGNGAQTTSSDGASVAASDERLVALYLDMLAAERGAGPNTLAAYGRDLADFTAFWRKLDDRSQRPRPTIFGPT